MNLNVIAALVVFLAAYSEAANLTDCCIRNFYASNRTRNAILLKWENPKTPSKYVKLSYSAEEYDLNEAVFLDGSTTSYTVSGLRPGSTFNLKLTLIAENGGLAETSSTPILSAMTSVAPVKTVKEVESTSDTLKVVFEPPEGYYDMVYFYGSDESESSEFSAVTRNDTDQVMVISLVPGNLIAYYFVTISEKDPDNTAESSYFYAHTKLDFVDSFVTDLSYKRVEVSLAGVLGSFDFITIINTLNSTDSYRYFTNKNYSMIQNCIPGYRTSNTLSYAQISAQDRFNLTNLCPLSLYSIEFIVSKSGYESVSSDLEFRTTYENVDCELVQAFTVNNRTVLRWPFSRMFTDAYLVKLYYLNESILYDSELPNYKNSTNSIDFFGLGHNNQYIFDIAVKYKKLTSLSCQQAVFTGDPCPEFDESHPIEFITGPYINKVLIRFSKLIFTNYQNILNYTIIVGVGAIDGKNCSDHFDPDYCRMAATWNFMSWSELEKEFQLSTNDDCQLNETVCNFRFKVDETYYVSMRGWSPCGYVTSSSIVIKIPTPFPLAMIVSLVAVGCCLVVVVVLAIVFRKSYNKVKVQTTNEEKSTKSVRITTKRTVRFNLDNLEVHL